MKRIFISYSHKDKEWREQLEKHLEILTSEEVLTWSDQDIAAGDNWLEEIKNAMNEADVAILLISADFLTSRFIIEKEIPSILQKRQKEGIKVLPIIIKPCAWKKVGWLSSIQARPKDGKPLSAFKDDEFQRDSIFAAIVEEVAEILRSKDVTGGTLNIHLPSTVPKPDERRSTDLSKTKEKRFELTIPCKGQPAWEVSTTNRVYLHTEANEWIMLAFGKENYEQLPSLPICSTAITHAKDMLVVGLYDMTVARFNENKWEFIPWSSAVLSLASTEIGVVVGDSFGKIDLLQKQRGTIIPTCYVQEAVIDIKTIAEEGMVLLGNRGGLWITKWPWEPQAELKRIDTSVVERLYAIFNGVQLNEVVLIGSTMLALLDFDTGSVKAFSEPFGESLRSVCCNFGDLKGYGVLTDFGGLYLVSRDLKSIRQVNFSIEEGEVIGISPLLQGGFLAWTTAGNLYWVSDNGTFRQLAGGGVVLAFAAPAYNGIFVVYWNADFGANVKLEHDPVTR